MWLVRLFVVFGSWFFLIYSPEGQPPQSSYDFFRNTLIFTLAMTYDYSSMFERTRPQQFSVRWWLFIALLVYTLIWLGISLMGIFKMAELTNDHHIELFTNTIFPSYDAMSQTTMLLCMLGYPLMALFEKMLGEKANISSAPQVS